uniref:Uncharacterized protein n=1 Tax=Panagrellus redivivus TaxID=6233 RepID=A0A7E4VEI7_PANRE
MALLDKYSCKIFSQPCAKWLQKVVVKKFAFAQLEKATERRPKNDRIPSANDTADGPKDEGPHDSVPSMINVFPCLAYCLLILSNWLCVVVLIAQCAKKPPAHNRPPGTTSQNRPVQPPSSGASGGQPGSNPSNPSNTPFLPEGDPRGDSLYNVKTEMAFPRKK